MMRAAVQRPREVDAAALKADRSIELEDVLPRDIVSQAAEVQRVGLEGVNGLEALRQLFRPDAAIAAGLDRDVEPLAVL
jgi:hypothetical protein